VVPSLGKRHDPESHHGLLAQALAQQKRWMVDKLQHVEGAAHPLDASPGAPAMTASQRRFWIRLRNKMLPPIVQYVLGITT